MRVEQIIADLPVTDMSEARTFYGDFLGLEHEQWELDWVSRFVDRSTGAAIQVVTRDATSPIKPIATIKVDDVDEAYAEAQRRGYEIVHPLSDEDWGIRRFFVRDPSGNVLNIARHRD